MDQLKDLLVDELQDLLNAENQLVQALPTIAQAAHNPKLREAIEKHLQQTRGHVERLKTVFDLLGEKPQSKACKGMTGLLQEGEERTRELREQEDFAADLGLIAAAQKVEHYEISGYGTARYLAHQIGEYEAAKLLSQTLGEEESADFMLSEIGKPLLQQALLADNTSVAPTKAKAQRA